MVKEIRIYIEGIGNPDETKPQPQSRPEYKTGIRGGKNANAGLRPGFKAFLKDLYDIAEPQGIKIELIVSGGRRAAYINFKRAIESHPEAFNVLLIDAESPINSNHTAWQHLRQREEDQDWIADSVDFDDGQCHLMVQAMEAWFIADLEALKQFYGAGFNNNKILRGLKQDKNVENVSVYNLEKWLKQATKHSVRKKYSKTQHAPKLLENLNVSKVRTASPYCDRLFLELTKILENPNLHP